MTPLTTFLYAFSATLGIAAGLLVAAVLALAVLVLVLGIMALIAGPQKDPRA